MELWPLALATVYGVPRYQVSLCDTLHRFSAHEQRQAENGEQALSIIYMIDFISLGWPGLACGILFMVHTH